MSLEESKNPNGCSRQGFEVNENPSKGNVTMNNSVASNALTGKITIANTEMAIIEYKGQRVVTLAMIDQVHGRAEGTAKRNFQTNKEHFVEGEDFYLIDFSQKNEFRTFGIEVPSRGLTVFTESGYLMLVKSFTDDLAWQVQRQLVKGYFKAQELLSNSSALALPNFTDPAEAAIAWAAEFKAKQLAQVQVVQLEAENQAMKTDVQALEQISKADGSLCITDAAKALQVNPKSLFSWLRENRWIYKRAGNSHDVGYQDKVQTGYLEHKVTEVTRGDGTTKITEQVRITPKGLAKLAKIFAQGEAA